ncbi:hypothetical protein LR69_01241 [Geobacillus sp. BCO2]|nr:hypothetical protein LR69_01241 [Geobacillus sp. BCO2]
MIQTKIVRTVVGWYNVYNVATDERVTLSPSEFFAVFNVARNVTLACYEISAEQAAKIGFKVVA